jgi:hypothetical protein
MFRKPINGRLSVWLLTAIRVVNIFRHIVGRQPGEAYVETSALMFGQVRSSL